MEAREENKDMRSMAVKALNIFKEYALQRV